MKDYYSKAAAELWPSGFIFSGAHTPGGELLRELMPLLNAHFLDPETLPLQSPSGRYARGIAHQPYFLPCRNPAYFAKNPGAIASLAGNVLDKEKSLGAAVLISPYFYVATRERMAFLKQLRGKSAPLNLQAYQEWMSKRSHRKLL